MAEQLATPKEEFLDSVRQTLGRSSGSGPQPPYPRLAETVADLEIQVEEMRQRLGSDQADRLDRLHQVAQLRGWKVFRTANPEDALEYIGSVANRMGIKAIARSDQEVFQQLPLEEAMERLGIHTVTIARDEAHSRESRRQEIIAAGMGITGADFAVAETGSVVVIPRRGLSRLVSVVPPVHLALVRPQDAVDTLDDVFLLARLQYHRSGGDMGSYLNFITGPSRTADIEQTLVIGVHGPKEVHMVLLG
jgi:L-lactate utilization protein LutB